LRGSDVLHLRVKCVVAPVERLRLEARIAATNTNTIDNNNSNNNAVAVAVGINVAKTDVALGFYVPDDTTDGVSGGGDVDVDAALRAVVVDPHVTAALASLAPPPRAPFVALDGDGAAALDSADVQAKLHAQCLSADVALTSSSSSSTSSSSSSSLAAAISMSDGVFRGAVYDMMEETLAALVAEAAAGVFDPRVAVKRVVTGTGMRRRRRVSASVHVDVDDDTGDYDATADDDGGVIGGDDDVNDDDNDNDDDDAANPWADQSELDHLDVTAALDAEAAIASSPTSAGAFALAQKLIAAEDDDDDIGGEETKMAEQDEAV
jgi:hypothetical protein